MRLRLALNELRSLEGLQGLTSLELLDVSGNKLEKLSAEQLRGLPKLDELLLSGAGLFLSNACEFEEILVVEPIPNASKAFKIFLELLEIDSRKRSSQ